MASALQPLSTRKLIGLGVLLLLTTVGLSAWSRYHATPTTIDGVLNKIEHAVNKDYGDVSIARTDEWMAEGALTNANKVNGYDFAVSGAGRRLTAYIDVSKKSKRWLVFEKQKAGNIDNVRFFIHSLLNKYGFRNGDNTTFRRPPDICQILTQSQDFENQDPGEGSNQVQLVCYDMGILAAAADSAKPFVDEYLRANPGQKAADLSVGPLTIKGQDGRGVISSSHTAGYDIAEMVVTTKTVKKIALYYQKDGVWRYITQADDEFGFPCGDMQKDPDARKALYNQVCLGENGQVRLDANNRALQ